MRPLPRRRCVPALLVALLVVVVAATGACRDGGTGSAGTPTTSTPTTGAPGVGGGAPAPTVAPPEPVGAQRVEVVGRRPHDADSFTEGFEIDGDTLLESAGLYGKSELRRVDPATGRVLARRTLPASAFGEGATRVGDRIVQLTWREHVAYVWDAATFAPRGTFRYDGEGWGLCDDGTRLVMSDGGARLTFRDRASFAVLGSVEVRDDAGPVRQLNELECVGASVYANVWQTDRIVRIDPASGRVLASIDASGLLSPAEAAGADVLNGIAYDATTGTFLVTGKLWPTVFEVRFVPAP